MRMAGLVSFLPSGFRSGILVSTKPAKEGDHEKNQLGRLAPEGTL